MLVLVPGLEFGLLELEPVDSLEFCCLTPDLGRVEADLEGGVGAVWGGLGGGQSLPEPGLTSLLPEENQDSLQDSQFEY